MLTKRSSRGGGHARADLNAIMVRAERGGWFVRWHLRASHSGRGGKQLLNPAHDSINPLVAAGVVALGSKTGEGAYSFEIVRGSTTKTLAGFVPAQWLDQLPAGASGR